MCIRDRPFIEEGIWDASPDEIDTLKAEVTEESVGAMIGVCWAHKWIDLETSRKAFDRGPEGLLSFGDSVLDELHEAGYSVSEISTIVSQVGSRVFESLIPSAKEVDERVGFSAPRPDSRTSLSSTSA